MKRVLSILLILVFILTLCIPVYATDNDNLSNNDETMPLPDYILPSHFEREPESWEYILRDYDDISDHPGVALLEKHSDARIIASECRIENDIGRTPVVKIYPNIYWKSHATKSLEDIISEAELEYVDYELLGDEKDFSINEYTPEEGKFKRFSYQKGSRIFTVEYSLPENLITELKGYVSCWGVTGKTEIVLMGEKRTITDIYFFEDRRGNGDILVYLVTDKGTFVKYYCRDYNFSMVLSRDQFQEYCKDFSEYLIASSVDDEGNQLYGTGISFARYLYLYHEYSNSSSEHTDQKDNDKVEQDIKLSLLWLPICCIGGIAIGGTATYLLMRTIRKKPKE